MYCTFCGKQIADEDTFCRYCGKPAAQSDTLTELVAAARTGSQDAVSALYEKTYSQVYYTVKSMIKDEDTVSDIVQDTYIKAFTHLDSFQGGTKFSPWVKQIAANTARDFLKKKRPVLFTELNPDNGQNIPVEEMFPDERSENLPDQVIDQKETTRLIREIIEELPEDQRAVIGMFYYEEMSVKEIAAAMDVSESAVKSRLMYGRNKIEKKVLELEKKGTKLYSLSPLPFLLLLFRNQKVYAAEAPDGRILRNILASLPTGATAGTAQGTTDTTGMAQGTTDTAQMAAGAGTAGAAATGLGALKVGLITLAAVAVVGLGAFGVTQIASRSAESQESFTSEDVIDQEEAAESASGKDEAEAQTEPVSDQEESEAQTEPAPIDEALEQYRIIIDQADSYEYGSIPDLELVGYRYALVQMQPDDPVPTLLLEKEEGGWTSAVTTRVFQYDPDTKRVHQPAETIGSGIRGGLSMAEDGDGIFDTQWSGGTGKGSVSRITLEGDSLNRETCWSGQIDLMPDSITSVEIEWHEIGDLSALDSWTAPESSGATPSGQAENGTPSADGEHIVLIGTVGTYDYDGIIALQGQPDPNGFDESTLKFSRSRTYRVILLDAPQTLYIHNGDGEGFSSGEASMIRIDDVAGMDQYEDQHITFSIDPAHIWWPADVSIPLGQPIATDIDVFE